KSSGDAQRSQEHRPSRLAAAEALPFGQGQVEGVTDRCQGSQRAEQDALYLVAFGDARSRTIAVQQANNASQIPQSSDAEIAINLKEHLPKEVTNFCGAVREKPAN